MWTKQREKSGRLEASSGCAVVCLNFLELDSEIGTGRNKRSLCLLISKGGFACALFSSALMGSLSIVTIYMMNCSGEGIQRRRDGP